MTSSIRLNGGLIPLTKGHKKNLPFEEVLEASSGFEPLYELLQSPA